MDRHTLLDYLRQPARLSEISLEELLRLTERYPYVTDLSLLLVLKAKQDNDEHYDRYLSRLAAATFDRPHLFDLLQEVEQPTEEEGGEVLELMELEDLELAPLPDPFEELPSRLNESNAPPPAHVSWPPDPAPEAEVSILSDKKDTGQEPDKVSQADNVAAPPPPVNSDDWVDLAVAYYAAVIVGPQGITGRQVEPEDPQRFAHLDVLSSVRNDLTERLLALRRRPPDHTRTGATTPPAMVSETLAELLVRQGQYEHALRVYRRLMLLYPEKKTIFAGLIEELKEKL